MCFLVPKTHMTWVLPIRARGGRNWRCPPDLHKQMAGFASILRIEKRNRVRWNRAQCPQLPGASFDVPEQKPREAPVLTAQIEGTSPPPPDGRWWVQMGVLVCCRFDWGALGVQKHRGGALFYLGVVSCLYGRNSHSDHRIRFWPGIPGSGTVRRDSSLCDIIVISL